MDRTKKFMYNSVATLFMQLVTMLAGFITPRVMLSVYGSEINGLVSSINQFISYFNLVEAGLAGASVYALYKPLAEQDHSAISAIVSATKRFYRQSGYVFISLTIGLACIYPVFVKSNLLSAYSISGLVIILGVSGTLEFFTLAKYRALLTADQKTYVISIASTLAIILNTVIIAVLASNGVSIVIVRLVALSSVFLRSLILLIYTKFKYPYINYNESPNNKALDKRWAALYLQLLGSVQTAFPIILATFMTSLKMVSVYSVFNMIIGGINGVLSIFKSGLSASFGDILARNERGTLKKAYREFEYAYYALITVVYSTAAVTIMSFVRIYTRNITDINYDLPVVGFLFVLDGLLFNLKTPQGMLVISAGHYKETRLQTGIQAVILIVLGFVLTPRWGLCGILVASICSNIYRDIDLMFYIPRKVTETKPSETLGRMIRVFVIASIVYALSLCFPISLSNFLAWAVYSFIVVLLVSAVTILFGFMFDRVELIGVFRRIHKMIGVGRR